MVVVVLVVVVPVNASTDNITSSSAMSPRQSLPDLPLLPTKKILIESPEKLSSDIVLGFHWSPWLPDSDHNSCVPPVFVDRTITFNEPILLAPFMW